MAKTKQQKEEAVKDLEDKVSKSTAAVFTNFEGLSVSETTELRKALRELGIEYAVAKRTLVQLVLDKQKVADASIEKLPGGLGIAFGFDDEVLPAKTLATFAKKHEALKLIGGIFQDRFIDEAEVKALASLPSKDELRVKLLWLIQYPTTGLVNVLAGNMRNFVYALNAIKDRKA